MVALMSAVTLVLLIASANVANLILMRGEGRRAEFGLRAALGATRARLVRQVLAESVMLTLLAVAVAVVAAWWSLHGLLALVPDGLPRVESVRIDATVLAFTAVVALVTALLSGLVPALSLSRVDLLAQLRGGGRGVTDASSRRWRRVVIVGQVALAVTIVSAAGLLGAVCSRLQAIDIGLAADRLVFVQLSLPQPKYAERARHAQFLEERLHSLRGDSGDRRRDGRQRDAVLGGGRLGCSERHRGRAERRTRRREPLAQSRVDRRTGTSARLRSRSSPAAPSPRPIGRARSSRPSSATMRRRASGPEKQRSASV